MGMTERERLAADLELLGALANATHGPAGNFYSDMRPAATSEARPVRSNGLWRRGWASFRAMSHRPRLSRLRPARPLPPAAVPTC